MKESTKVFFLAETHVGQGGLTARYSPGPLACFPPFIIGHFIDPGRIGSVHPRVFNKQAIEDKWHLVARMSPQDSIFCASSRTALDLLSLEDERPYNDIEEARLCITRAGKTFAKDKAFTLFISTNRLFFQAISNLNWNYVLNYYLLP